MKRSIISGMAIGVLALYFGAYHALVVRVVGVTGYLPFGAIKEVEAQYRCGGRTAYWLFWPAFQIEQRLLPGLWEIPPDVWQTAPRR